MRVALVVLTALELAFCMVAVLGAMFSIRLVIFSRDDPTNRRLGSIAAVLLGAFAAAYFAVMAALIERLGGA